MSEIDWDKVFRIPTKAELHAFEQQHLAAKGDVLSSHRGYDIVQTGPTSFEVWHGSFRQTSCGSAWSCICYIDERLSP